MIDVLIVVLFICYAVWSGFSSRKDASKGPEEYFLAGRSMSGWKAGLSMTATQYAADTPLVVTGMIATAGVFALWRFWVYSIAFLLMGFLLAPAWRRSGILTDAELCEKRYSGKGAEVLRYLKAFYFGTVFNCVVLAFVLLAATRITEPFLPWHEWLGEGAMSPIAALVELVGKPLTASGLDQPDVWMRSASNLFSIMIIVTFTTLYSATGGLRSVINTDAVQVILAFIATAIYAYVVATAIGGLDQIPVKLTQLYGEARMNSMLSFNPGEGAGEMVATVVGLLGIQWFAQMNSDGTGYLAQRSMACKSDKEAQTAAVIFTYAQSVLRTLLWLPIIVGLMVLYPADGPVVGEAATAARESVFVQGVAEHLPTGALGLMLVGLLAALSSTVDTHLNWGASYWTNDFYDRLYCQRIKGRKADPKRLVWVARISNMFILGIGLAIMTQLGSIQTAWKISLLFGAGMGIPLLLRWLWHRQNAWGELVPIMLSIVVAPALLFGLPKDEHDALRLILMTVIATVASVVASLVTAPVDESLLNGFFEEANPPGFWGAVAKRSGVDDAPNRRTFWRGIASTAAASGSVFGMIIGFGTLILHAPSPEVMPRWLWIGLTLTVGFGLIPVWWKLSNQGQDEETPKTPPPAGEAA